MPQSKKEVQPTRLTGMLQRPGPPPQAPKQKAQGMEPLPMDDDAGFTFSIEPEEPAEKKKKKPRKPKEPKEPRVSEPKSSLKYQIIFLLIFLGFWSVMLSLWIIALQEVDASDGNVLSPDGIVNEITPTPDTVKEQFEEKQETKDFSNMPKIIDGFGEVNKPSLTYAVGDVSYKSATELYVLTKQKASELGIKEPGADGVVADESGGFAWTVKDGDTLIEAGYINGEEQAAVFQAIYPDEYKEKKDYMDNREYNWYKLTIRSAEKEPLSKEKCQEPMQTVFGTALDPEKTIVIYQGGTKYEKQE